MKKNLLLFSLLMMLSMLTGCAILDGTTGNSDRDYDRYNYGGGSYSGGHSHH